MQIMLRFDVLFYEGVDLLVAGDFPASYKSGSPVFLRVYDSETPAPLIFLAN